jgi:predicted nuclease of predicted toxin-antitoxin system
LSYRLVRQLVGLPIEVVHVSRTGLPIPADDREIWAWAKANDYVVLTNDEDFYRFAGALGFPPKVVMLRTSNQSTRFMADLLARHLTDIQQLNDSLESGVLELF